LCGLFLLNHSMTSVATPLDLRSRYPAEGLSVGEDLGSGLEGRDVGTDSQTGWVFAIVVSVSLRIGIADRHSGCLPQRRYFDCCCNAFRTHVELFDPRRCCLNARSRRWRPLSSTTTNIEQQITKIGSFREGKRISREQFWVDGNAIYFALRYGKQPLEISRGMSTLKAATWDDLVAQLDEIKTITVAGGLDDALSACASAVRSNFKAAKDKKAAKGSP
jgi:hypothetical protein